jgi:hypothetical protein
MDAYWYEFTSLLRLNSAKVSPFGAEGEVQIKEETTERCLKFEDIL